VGSLGNFVGLAFFYSLGVLAFAQPQTHALSAAQAIKLALVGLVATALLTLTLQFGVFFGLAAAVAFLIPSAFGTVERLLLTIDGISTWVGKGAAWLIIGLMLLVVAEVFKRYALNMPTAWIFDASNMFYGTLFMLCGAYTLAQNGHVRGDFLYSSFKPRTQASLDLVLYIAFFLPGILALVYAGYSYAGDSWRINEHSNVTANGPPVYHFKTVIPVAGALVLLQGFAEVVRCVMCLKTGDWPARLKDVNEIDVIEQQLGGSDLVDAESRNLAIDNAKNIDEAARQRGRGGDQAQ
jgi:TRAP-type mannitol/chloroaromatic compound transport system permease small subunit